MSAPRLLDAVDWSDEFGYVRVYYRVDPKRGQRVTVNGKPGVITSGAGHYIRVRFDGERLSAYCHPTWRFDYNPAPGTGAPKAADPAGSGVGSDGGL